MLTIVQGYPIGMDPNGTDPIQFYVNPNDAKDVVFGANEFVPGATTFEVNKTNQFSVDVNIYANKAVYGDTKMATFTLVQGMGFFTGRYKNLTPRLSSVVPINFVEVPAPSGITQKWRLTLEDGNKWLVYAKADPGSSTDGIKFSLLTGGRHIASTLPPFSGVIQVAKIPNTVGGVEKFEPIYDQTCGAYPIGASLDGSVTGTTGRYTLAYQYEGSSQLGKMVIWALPHHVSSFDSATASALTGMRLRSTTKGMMTAVVANSLTMVEPNLPTEIGWLPGGDTMTPSIAEAVAYAASIELPLQDISAATNLNSMYWAGKVFGKYAQVCSLSHAASRTRVTHCSPDDFGVGPLAKK
jgi:endo-1,3(4)-beta-glucanase